jgi:hypothetical protein
MSGKPGMRSRLKRTLPVKYGQDFVSTLDGRYRLGREVRSRLDAIEADLGGMLSHAQRSLVRRVVWVELCIEHEEARIGEGGGIDIGPHTQLVNTLLALYKTLGLQRRAKQIPLADYLTEKGRIQPTK